MKKLIKRLFCGHLRWIRTEQVGFTIYEHTCIRCGKKIHRDIDQPPVSWIGDSKPFISPTDIINMVSGCKTAKEALIVINKAHLYNLIQLFEQSRLPYKYFLNEKAKIIDTIKTLTNANRQANNNQRTGK